MKTFKIILIVVGVIATLSFAIPVNAQQLPQIPTLEKPISQMTIPEIKAKIAEILAVVQQLQALLAQLTGQGIPGIPGGFSFENNLKYGTSNNEVKYLQIVLNTDPETRVSDTGWGSPGQESIYFGPKTLQAVIKFQEKYTQDVLSPYNLTKGTGYVGKTTRAKLIHFSSGRINVGAKLL